MRGAFHLNVACHREEREGTCFLGSTAGGTTAPAWREVPCLFSSRVCAWSVLVAKRSVHVAGGFVVLFALMKARAHRKMAI
jgi:hypothetical protein